MNGYDEELPDDEFEELVPFDTVMDDLFSGETIHIHQLYRLSDMAPEEMAQFQREWASADTDRRLTMVKHMAELAEDNYIVDFGPVFAHVFSDPAPEIRQAALEGVWDTTDTELIEPIVSLLTTDDSISVRASAARALAHYILLTEWGQLDARQTFPAVKALLATLDNPESADQVRRAALEAVAAAGEPEIKRHIQDAYDNGNTDYQLSALFAMGNSADPYWLPILIEEMSSSDPDLRAEAARAAGAIGDSSAVNDLIELCSDEDREVAEAAVLALGQIGGDEAYEFLSQLADDDNFAELQEAADVALEEMDWAVGEFDLLAFEDDEDDLSLDMDDPDDDLVA